MDVCSTCPVASPGTEAPIPTCYAIRSGVARLCELAATRRDYRDLVVARTWSDADDPQESGLAPGPGLASRVTSFAVALAAHVADGGRIAPNEVQAARLALCQACPFVVGGLEATGCRKCGCSMPVKRSWASSYCPDDPPRWAPV